MRQTRAGNGLRRGSLLNREGVPPAKEAGNIERIVFV